MDAQTNPFSFDYDMQASSFNFQYPIGYPSTEALGHGAVSSQSSLSFPLTEPSFQLQLDNPLQPTQVSNANERSMPPPPKRRKAKAPTMREEDWKPFQPRIVQLYRNENQTVPKIQEIIEEEFGVKFT